MTDNATPDKKPPRKRKRLFVLGGGGLVLAGALVATYFLVLRAPPPPPPEPVAPKVVEKKKPEPPKLGLEYAYDRNALLDLRRISPRYVALAKAGNLLTFDETTLEWSGEKVFGRAATCLGPVLDRQVVVGLANGAILRVSPKDFSATAAGIVPGIPRWVQKHGNGLVVAYQPSRPPLYDTTWRLTILDSGKEVSIPPKAALFKDNAGLVWIGAEKSLSVVNLETSTTREIPLKGLKGLKGHLEGFVEPSEGEILAFGGDSESAFIARVDGKPKFLYQAPQKIQEPGPASAIKAVLPYTLDDSFLVLSSQHVYTVDRGLGAFKPFEGLEGGDHNFDGVRPAGQVHLQGNRLVFALGRGGIMELTPDRMRRHMLRDQDTVVRPMEIARLGEGMAIYGDGGPRYLVDKAYRSLPDAISPPGELMGRGREGESERVWAAMMTLPISGEQSYVIAKAGPPRHYLGHLHGIHDTVLTAKWDGTTMTVLGREDLPIEPEDTFITPDRQLWNVDDQGLWNFAGGHWRLVMRSEDPRVRPKSGRVLLGPGILSRSAIGEPLHFVDRHMPPYFGTPRLSSGWSLVRLDVNEAGGVPLIEEVVVRMDGRRLRIHDAVVWGNQKMHLLLATDQGLCAYNVKFGGCEPVRPTGLTDEVTLFMKDGTKRIWLGGRGLWVFRDPKTVEALHPWLPMLTDTRVLSLAEMPDGRLMVGLEGRGMVVVSLPSGWLFRDEPLPPMPAYEGTQDHEPLYGDPSLQLSMCKPKTAFASDAALRAYVHALEAVVRPLGPRARVEIEMNYEFAPDLALRGADLDELLKVIQPVLAKSKLPVAIYRRAGARGSVKVEAQRCR